MKKLTTTIERPGTRRMPGRRDLNGNGLSGRQVATSVRKLYRYQVPRPKRSVALHDGELPSRYDQTRFVLLPRDPYYLNAYWEIAPSDLEAMQKRIGPDFNRSTYTLRMHDVTAINFNGRNANKTFDIDVSPHTNSWSINLWSDNVSLCGEVGMRTPEGKFYSYTQSNVAFTPPSGSSGRSDMIWMDIRNQRNNAFVFTWPRARRIVKAMSTFESGPARTHQPPRKTFITDNDIRTYYASLYPLLSKVRPFRKNRNGNGNGKNVKSAKPKGGGLKAANRERVEDALIPGVSKNEYYRKLLGGASAELLEKKGASEQIFSGASEWPAHQRNFFFEVWTELIVHGRTEPDARVELNGNEVKLRQDGTFTLRYALPDGRIPLDFLAVSHDKVESRKITTAVERMRTVYSP